jgi:integrase/recombinase XerD
VTHLRKMMLEELERRNYSESTKRVYPLTIEDLARYFKRPPDQLEPPHVRQYQAYFVDRKLSPNTVNQRTGALRFFFITVLRKSWSIADTPYPKRHFRLPKVLSQRGRQRRLVDGPRRQNDHRFGALVSSRRNHVRANVSWFFSVPSEWPLLWPFLL